MLWNAFLDTIDNAVCNILEDFNLCITEITKLFFSSNSIDAQVKCIYKMHKPKEIDAQQFTLATGSFIQEHKH